MTAKVHLIRHGAHDDVGHVLSGRSARSPLSAVGQAQAQWLAAHFAREASIDAIHCSPRERTRATADIIAARVGADVQVVEALDEIDFGEWTGRSFDTLEQDPAWHEWNCNRAGARPPHGEGMADATARAVGHIDALVRGGWGGTLLCVSHCDIIRGVVAHYLGLGLDRLLAFDVDPGSVSTLLIGGWGSRLLKLNGGQE
ncbi:histidine phosphatase family protein [Sphingomonas sp. HT-1]|uniref:histidine phosphatase family protein n=1 Tax=unclassified Sphingomonas TaxID=196159 RepID=UPI000373AA8F|nr:MULTISPECIES: histidine phosphatase family protein [unclassified Sphingomonas]KTF69500.1 phosphoglycerate mutase [Sphingomonas sp. WG]